MKKWEIEQANREYEEEKLNRQIHPVLPKNIYDRLSEFHISPYGIRGYIVGSMVFDDKETSLENLQRAWGYAIAKGYFPKST